MTHGNSPSGEGNTLLFRASFTTPAETAGRFAEALENAPFPEPCVVGHWAENDAIWHVDAYYDHEPDPASIVKLLETAASAIGVTAPAVTVGPVEDRDWVRESQSMLRPIEAGRFLLYGSHDRHRNTAGRVNIEIDAGLAFGTGHHGTTLGCLTALTEILKRSTPRRILDLGCGTGVLAIAVAKHEKCRVLASDIDPVATRTARQNARLNSISPMIGFATAAGLEHVAIRRAAPFDLVLANILAGPLVRLAPGLSQAISERGRIVLSGLLRHQEPRVIAAYRLQGFVFEKRIRVDEWSTLIMSRAGQRPWRPFQTI